MMHGGLRREDLTWNRGLAKVVTLVLLAAAAALWRIHNSSQFVVPNLEFVTAATFLAYRIGSRRLAMLVSFGLIVLTDAVIGTISSEYLIFLFTWSAWLGIGWGTQAILRRGSRRAIVRGVAFAALAPTFFFLWTNLGVWLLGRGTYYSAGFDGLLDSYVAGLPFYRNQLLGAVLSVLIIALVLSRLDRSSPGESALGDSLAGEISARVPADAASRRPHLDPRRRQPAHAERRPRS